MIKNKEIEDIKQRLEKASETLSGIKQLHLIDGKGIPKDNWTKFHLQVVHAKAAMNQFLEKHKDDGTFI